MDAVDIAPTMVAAGRRAPAGDHPHIRWACSPLETFAADPPYALIVAGASLHWMEWEVVLPRFASWLAPGGVLALLDQRTEPTPWGNEMRPVVTRFSTNRDFRPYTTRTIADELARRGLFREQGEMPIAPVPFAQPVADYIAAILAHHCPGGLVRLQVGATPIWGAPLTATGLTTISNGP